MKSSRSSQLSLVLTSALVSLSLPLFAKPASKASPAPNPGSPQAPAPAPTTADPAGNELLAHWLVEQNGGQESIKVPFAQTVKAATGKTVLSINPSDARDAAIIAKIGGALDQLLPRMNRPDSTAHLAARDGTAEEIAECFEEQLRTLLRSAPAPGSGEAADTQPGSTRDSVYPALRIADSVTGKAYYLAVAMFPTGKRELITRAAGVARALTIHPADTARRITADGCCLLVGIEYDGKVSPGMAFLNWELIDLAPLALRLSVTFDAEGSDLRSPGAVITDGRKGRD